MMDVYLIKMCNTLKTQIIQIYKTNMIELFIKLNNVIISYFDRIREILFDNTRFMYPKRQYFPGIIKSFECDKITFQYLMCNECLNYNRIEILLFVFLSVSRNLLFRDKLFVVMKIYVEVHL